MDNLRVHKTNAVREVLEELEIEVIWAPVYSPEYNPIELVFSQYKHIVKNMRLKDMLMKRQRAYKKLIPLAVQQVTVDKIDRCIRHTNKVFEIE